MDKGNKRQMQGGGGSAKKLRREDSEAMVSGGIGVALHCKLIVSGLVFSCLVVFLWPVSAFDDENAAYV